MIVIKFVFRSALLLTCCLVFAACVQQEQDYDVFNENNQALPLFKACEVISVEEYQERYGPDIIFENPVARFADQIMRVSLNQVILEPGPVKAEGQILFNITDRNGYMVNIQKAESNEIFSIRGYIEDSPQNIFLLSVEDDAVLALLEIIEENVLYVILTNPQSGNLYLFKTPGDKIERLECGGPLMPAVNNDQHNHDRNNDQKKDRNTDQNREEPGRAPEDNQELLLLYNLHEISRDSYIGKYGKQRLMDNPVAAAAERIGEVTINIAIFKPGLLKPGDLLALPGFDEKEYHANIDNIAIDNIADKTVLSVRARIAEHRFGMLVLTFADNKVLATLELAEKNTIYLINYNPFSDKHYLFKAAMDKVEKLEGEPSLIPPDNENKTD